MAKLYVTKQELAEYDAQTVSAITAAGDEIVEVASEEEAERLSLEDIQSIARFDEAEPIVEETGSASLLAEMRLQTQLLRSLVAQQEATAAQIRQIEAVVQQRSAGSSQDQATSDALTPGPATRRADGDQVQVGAEAESIRIGDKVQVRRPEASGEIKPKPRHPSISQKSIEKRGAILWLVQNFAGLADYQIANLTGSPPPMVRAIRAGSNRTIRDIRPQDPVELGFCTLAELEDAVEKSIDLIADDLEDEDDEVAEGAQHQMEKGD